MLMDKLGQLHLTTFESYELIMLQLRTSEHFQEILIVKSVPSTVNSLFPGIHPSGSPRTDPAAGYACNCPAPGMR